LQKGCQVHTKYQFVAQTLLDNQWSLNRKYKQIIMLDCHDQPTTPM
jgi:hypothetical protein